MLTDEFLTRAEVRQLTGKAQARLQCAYLDAEGIPYKVRDGQVLVSRVHVRQWLAGQPIEAVRSPVMENVR